MTNFNDIPTFSNPVTRADFNKVQTMLTAYFVSKGLSQSDAVAQAGGVINAQLSGGSVTQNIQQTSDTQAAQAAQRAADQAAADAKNAAILAAQKTSDNAKAAIANAALQAERAKLANFGDNETVGMCADPDNPSGAKIPCDQANAKLAARQLTTQSYNAPASSVIDQHTIDALKNQGTPLLTSSKVVNITKPFETTPSDPLKTTPSSDPIKTGITVLTNDAAAVQTVLSNAIAGAQQTGADILKAAQDALSGAGLAATDAGKAALDQLTKTVNGTGKTITDAATATGKAASDAAAAAAKTLSDAATAAQKAASDAAAAATKAAQDAIAQGTKAAQDAAAATLKAAQDAAAAAADAAAKAAAAAGTAGGTAASDLTSINLTLQKLLGLIPSTTDPTKTTTPTPPTPSPTDNNNNSTQPPAAKTSFMDAANAFLKKYAVPITLGISATGALIFATSRMSKRSEIISQ